MLALSVILKFTAISVGTIAIERTTNVMLVSAELMFSLRISDGW